MKEEMKDIGALTPRGSPLPTPEQMLAELTEGARHFVGFERLFGAFGGAGAGRRATIKSLKENAHKIGFAADEIDSAVTAALAEAERESDTRGEANPPPQGSAP